MRVAAHRGARLDRTLQNPPAGQQQPCGQRHTSKCPGSYLGATHRARAQQRRVVLARLARTNVQGRTTRARLDRTLQNPPARQQQPCGQRHASTYPGSYLGATHRARVQQRRVVLARLVTTDPRGRAARCPPTASRTQIGRSDKTDLAPNEFHQSTRVAILHHTHPSVALVHARLPRSQIRSPNEPDGNVVSLHFHAGDTGH